MKNPRLTVCLDNNDYSILSDPSKATYELDTIRGKLLDWASSGLVTFAFAGTHLMEMAPLEAAFTPQAAARADLLAALCGKNALISFERVFEAEVARAAELRFGSFEVLNADANGSRTTKAAFCRRSRTQLSGKKSRRSFGIKE